MTSKGDKVNLLKAVGRVSLGVVTPYPPGIPVICPGEVFSEELIAYLYDILFFGRVHNSMNL